MSAPSTYDEVLAERVARALWSACVADVRVMRPSHVCVRAPTEGASNDDIQSSAQVAAPALTARAGGVGERILAAVEATRHVVSSNTNLGILILCAPLVHAVLSENRGHTLRQRVGHVLAELTVEDAELVKRAIRLAAVDRAGDPSTTVDWPLLATDPGLTLRQGMDAVAREDRIAWQYSHDYIDVFAYALPRLRHAKAMGGKQDWPLAVVYFGLLARFPDSYLVRRYGIQAARAVSASAKALGRELWGSRYPQQYAGRVRAFDEELRKEGFYPRTTADLAVVTLLAARLQNWVGRPPEK